jgi:type I restriction enzyme S subunit
MNQTLEAMAQALFKSWFVDFDPVLDNALAAGNPIPEALHAKAEKRKDVPDHLKLRTKNSTLAKLFPSAFVFNETLDKWIPEGWEVKSFGTGISNFQTKYFLEAELDSYSTINAVAN